MKAEEVKQQLSKVLTDVRDAMVEVDQMRPEIQDAQTAQTLAKAIFDIFLVLRSYTP